MSDIRCAVCGEPWDQWGANHGDMKWWEYDLFKAGAGCPACEGEAPDEDLDVDIEDVENHLKDVVSNAEDPDSWGLLHGDPDKRPEWVEPEPKVLWTCAGCGVRCIISNEAPYDGKEINKDDVFLEWDGGDKVHYRSGCGPFRYGDILAIQDPTRKPEHIVNDQPYCPGCADECACCDETILTRADDLAPGDNGWCGPHPFDPMRGSVCYQCTVDLEEELEEEDGEEDEEDYEAWDETFPP